jgi:predicted HTH transcriptional regulator
LAITPEQIDIWRQSRPEHQRLEFKEARQEYDSKKLSQYCAAIANEGGGFLVLGVSDVPPRQVVGTSECRDIVNYAQKLFEALGFRVDIEEVEHPSGRVLVFEIPPRPKGNGLSPGRCLSDALRRSACAHERGSASAHLG